MSEWSVPSGMTPQDNPGQPKDGIDALVKRVRDNAVEMRDRFNNLLKQAGIRVEPDLVRFTGAVRVEGTLDLPAGIIGNEALASPVTGDTDTAFVSGVSLTSTSVAVAAVSVPVPAGFTIARVMATSTLGVAGGAAAYCATTIQGNTGGQVTGFYGFAGSSNAVTLSGLSGGTVTASTLAGSYPNSSATEATTTIFVVFLR